jgi:hypothetical protein
MAATFEAARQLLQRAVGEAAFPAAVIEADTPTSHSGGRPRAPSADATQHDSRRHHLRTRLTHEGAGHHRARHATGGTGVRSV